MTDTGTEVLGTLSSSATYTEELIKTDQGLARRVSHDLSANPEARGALVSALRRAKSLSHERLQEVRTAGGDRYFLAVQPGEAIGALQRAAIAAHRDPLPPEAVVHIALQVAEGLGVLHDAGQSYGGLDLNLVNVSLEGSVTLQDRPGMALSAHLARQAAGSPLADIRAWSAAVRLLVEPLGEADELKKLLHYVSEVEAGAFVDAVFLCEALSTIVPDPAVTRGWLEENFATRWAHWRRYWGQESAGQSICDLLSSPVEAEAPVAPELPDILLPGEAVSGVEVVVEDRPTRRRYGKGLPDEGYVPELFDPAEEAEDYVAPCLSDDSIDDILEPLLETVASGDPNSALVLEVVRVRQETAMQAAFVHVGKTFRYGGHKLARMTERGAQIFIPEGARAKRYRLGKMESLQNKDVIEAGERAALAIDGRLFRLRVDRAAREVGRATGVKKPYKLWGICAALGLGLHIGFFLFVMSLSSMGIQLTVEREAEEERFAHLKPPSELPKDKPKPKKKIKKKKKKPKPKPKPEAKKVRPKPKPPEEAAPVIPDRLREKLKTRTARRTQGSRNATEALLKQLAAPDPSDAPSVSDIRANIDAVKGSGRSGAFQVAGDLVAGVPGAKIEVAGASGGVVTKGKSGKGVGRVGKRARGGRTIRGKVKASKVMAKVRGSLSKAAVSKAINSRIGRIQRCYEKELMKSNKTLSGKIKAEWTVTTSGRVRGAKVKLNTLGNQKVASCVLKEIKKIKFPKPKGGEVVIVYPFIFSSR